MVPARAPLGRQPFPNRGRSLCMAVPERLKACPDTNQFSIAIQFCDRRLMVQINIALCRWFSNNRYVPDPFNHKTRSITRHFF